MAIKTSIHIITDFVLGFYGFQNPKKNFELDENLGTGTVYTVPLVSNILLSIVFK
jgi:hypothetical protein